MDTAKPAMAFGRYVFGLGVLALGLISLAWNDFDSGQPVPKDFPARSVLVYVAAAIMIVASAAVLWRRTAAWGGAALAAYYALIVVLLMDGRGVIARFADYGSYSNAAGQLAIAAGGLMVYAANAPIDAALAKRLMRVGHVVFGVCAVLWGGAHFFYMNLTAPLVPTWLPPSQTFWGYATGVFHIAAGVAILTGIQARLASILLTIMYASFTPLVHAPMLLAGHATHFIWSENAVNITFAGIAWMVADSLARKSAALVD